ncbi:MAG: hypothetical protein IPJ81_16000 [Chitinophagaceae bacterium]|jgi:uncharacterized membrane protein|nr:hypothetical protein [Chitinophagaceae bacterium]
MKYFVQKNYVFVSAILSALILVLQQFIGATSIDWPAISYAAFVAIAGTVANEWKGKGITIAGIIGTVANTFITVENTGNFTWDQFVLSVLVAILTAFVTSLKPPVKPR